MDMGECMESGGRAESGHGPTTGERLGPHEFADRYAASSRALWCIAAGVVNDRSLADDVLQEAAMIALRKLDQFEPGTNFLAWMGRIVRYTALNTGRRRARVRAAEGEGTALDLVAARRGAEAAPSPLDARGRLRAAGASFDDEVLAALGHLEDVPRSCLLLRTVLELPYADIARALDIPEGTAMSHVHRARRSMRARLEATEETPRP